MVLILNNITFIFRMEHIQVFSKPSNIGGSVKTYSKPLFIFSISECLFIAFFMFGIVWLYVRIIDFCLILRGFRDKAVVFFQRWLSLKLQISPIFLLCDTYTFLVVRFAKRDAAFEAFWFTRFSMEIGFLIESFSLQHF